MRDYWQSILALRWRAWLTDRYVGAYLTDRTFYRIAAEGVVDNPDQRINADIGAFTGTALVRPCSFAAACAAPLRRPPASH